MLDDVEILLDFVLDYGSKGLLPNMDEGGSGDIAYEAALRLKEVTPARYPSLPEDWDECVEAVMNTDLEKETADDPL